MSPELRSCIPITRMCNIWHVLPAVQRKTPVSIAGLGLYLLKGEFSLYPGPTSQIADRGFVNKLCLKREKVSSVKKVLTEKSLNILFNN